MKTISVRQFASIKRIYMNVNPLIVKKNKLISKINELTVEIAQLNDEIEGNEMGIKTITDGLSSEEILLIISLVTYNRKDYLKKYRLNLPFIYKFKRIMLKTIINLIPIKSKRKRLREEYHV